LLVTRFLTSLSSLVKSVVSCDNGGLVVPVSEVVLSGNKRARRNPEHSWKHCLIMDEVDGMSGNEDRGGIQVPQIFIYLVTF